MGAACDGGGERRSWGGGGQWEGGSATPTPRLVSGSEEFVGVNHATGARQLLLPNRQADSCACASHPPFICQEADAIADTPRDLAIPV